MFCIFLFPHIYFCWVRATDIMYYYSFTITYSWSTFPPVGSWKWQESHFVPASTRKRLLWISEWDYKRGTCRSFLLRDAYKGLVLCHCIPSADQRYFPSAKPDVQHKTIKHRRSAGEGIIDAVNWFLKWNVSGTSLFTGRLKLWLETSSCRCVCLCIWVLECVCVCVYVCVCERSWFSCDFHLVSDILSVIHRVVIHLL